jgi:hypothetical protein
MLTAEEDGTYGGAGVGPAVIFGIEGPELGDGVRQLAVSLVETTH